MAVYTHDWTPAKYINTNRRTGGTFQYKHPNLRTRLRDASKSKVIKRTWPLIDSGADNNLPMGGSLGSSHNSAGGTLFNVGKVNRPGNQAIGTDQKPNSR